MSETSDEDDTRTDRQSEAETRRADELSEDDEREHLSDVEDGCGCAEVWEHLSERRGNDD